MDLDVDWIIDNQFESNFCAKPILDSQTKREKERSWKSRNLSAWPRGLATNNRTSASCFWTIVVCSLFGNVMLLNWKLTLVDCPLRSRSCSTPPWRQPPPPGNLCKFQIRISYSRKASQNIQQILTSAKLLADNRPNQPLECLSYGHSLPSSDIQLWIKYWIWRVILLFLSSFQKVQTDFLRYAPEKCQIITLTSSKKAHRNSLSNKKTLLEFVSPDSFRRMRPYSSALCRLLPFSLFSLSNTWFFFHFLIIVKHLTLWSSRTLAQTVTRYILLP